MKKAACLAALALALMWAISAPAPARDDATDVPQAISELAADASPEQSERALQAMIDWLAADFAAARPIALRWATDPSLGTAFRIDVLNETINAARAAQQLDLEPAAGEAYRQLLEVAPPGALQAALHHSYGNLNLWTGRFAEAESMFRLSGEQLAETDFSERADMNNSLGVALAQQGKYDQSLEAMLEAYRLFEQTEDGPSAFLLRNIGGLHIYLENWEEGESFTRQALAKSPPDAPSLGGLYSNLAAALTEQGRLQEALEALETGIAIGEARGAPNARAVGNLGYVLRELGRPQEALAQFERGLALNQAAGDISAQAVAMKNIGETLIELDQREAADEALQESLALYRQADLKPKRLELYPVMVDNLEQLQRYPEALAMMREYQTLKEEIVSSDTQTRVAELQNAFDLERKQRELAESERQRLAGEAQLASLETAQTRQRHLRTLLLTGVVGLVLILSLLLRMLQIRNRANRLLSDKNAQIDAQHQALVETNEHLRRQSVEDELTGLGNRRSIRELLTTELPEHLAGRESLLMLIDLDRFKGINDQFGHPVGDQVLIKFAQALRTVADPDDVIARWGGEEFLWVVANAGLDQAAEHCEALARQIRSTEFRADGRSLSVTASIGVAAMDPNSDNPQAAFDLALKIADAALYEAKDAGRNSWAGFQRRVDDPEHFKGSLDIEGLVSQGALVRKRLQRAGH